MLDPSIVGELHYNTARNVQKLLQDYKSLQEGLVAVKPTPLSLSHEAPPR
jgi:F0F1-type ATP synthase beta subunit